MRVKFLIFPALALFVVIFLLWSESVKPNQPDTPTSNLRLASVGLCVIDNKIPSDSAMESTIAVYRERINDIMAEPLCKSVSMMEARRPESSLTRFLSDVLLTATQEFAADNGFTRPDMSLINIGGIRDILPEGSVTVGDVYTISPFENSPVVLSLDSAGVMAMLNHVAERGGEAISGVTMSINGKTAKNVKVCGQSLTGGKNYRLATLDYLATGGDGFHCLTNKTDYETGVVFRDMFITYLRRLGESGVAVDDPGNVRITIESTK